MALEKTNVGNRIGSMFLDHMSMTMIGMIFFLPGFVSGISSAMTISHEQTNPDFFGKTIYLSLIGLAIYFCKDCINGRSIGKRAIKLQVVENRNGNVASPIRTFVRNIFIIIWPIEVIVTLISPSRRIGDFVAGTKVVPFNPMVEQPKSIHYKSIGVSLVFAYGLVLLLMFAFKGLMPSTSSRQIVYVEKSLNEQSATETEKLFADSLGALLTADIRVYDQIKDVDSLKYVSVILLLNEDYLENDEDFDNLKSATIPLLLSKYPEKTFVGRVKYVYQQPGSMRTRVLPLDWRYLK